MKMRRQRRRYKVVHHTKVYSRPFRYSRKVWLLAEWEDGYDDYNSWINYRVWRWK